MAQEILTPTFLQTNVGPFRDFDGQPLFLGILEDLSDGNSGTGIQTDSNSVATISFSFTSSRFITFDTAILQYRIEALASGGKGAIITTFSILSLPINTFSGLAVAGDIKEVDISSLSMEQINNGIFGFNITNVPNITRISEVKIILTITGGRVEIAQGKINLKEGKILI